MKFYHRSRIGALLALIGLVGATGAAALLALAGPALAQNATRTRLTPAPSPSAVGQPVRLIAEVDAAGGGAATGSVLFRTGVTALGTRALAAPGAGQATVATGGHHSCALTGAGGVKCWGDNRYGQLGDGTTKGRFTPVDVAGLASGVKAIAAGANHTCALTNAGGVKCWGYIDEDRLGGGPPTLQLTPVSVLGLASGVKAIAAGANHACALTSAGGVSCWGYNSSGQLGDGTTTARRTAGGVVGLSSGVLAIAAGRAHTCAVTSAGSVKCWGYNGNGQLGDGTTDVRLTPVNVPSLASGVAAITAGEAHTCALTSAGGVKCWGNNSAGRLGDETNIQRLTPVNVSGLANGVAVAAGSAHTCALTSLGAVKCWGYNGNGQLGDGTTHQRLTPVNVTSLASGVVAIAAGASHSCASTSAGGVKCWGYDYNGQLGDGRGGYRTAPATVAGLSTGVAEIAGDDSHSCALTSAGGVKCWGRNKFGQLGDGTKTSRLTPVDVSGLASGVARIAAGEDHSCALTSAGRVKCWGHNLYGQLGDGTITDRLTPVDLVGVPSNMAVIAVGARHGCARALRGAGGYVVCWGNNEHGQLGDGTTTHRHTAVRVPLPSMFGLVAGDYHTCASYLEGGVRCWGKNSSGQLGNGTFTQQPIPVVVPGLEGVVAMAAGRDHTCALTGGGAVKCWGENSNGQLGDGTRTKRNAPVDVAGLTSGVAAIAAGGDHTCALTGGGAVYCWGANDQGQLGDGTTTQRLTPVNVTSLASGVARIAAGGSHTCALTSAGAAQCWGDNYYGQLGDGVPVFRVTPMTTLSLLALVRSRAQLTTATLGRGLHSLSAVYSGDANHSGSTGVASHLVQ